MPLDDLLFDLAEREIAQKEGKPPPPPREPSYPKGFTNFAKVLTHTSLVAVSLAAGYELVHRLFVAARGGFYNLPYIVSDVNARTACVVIILLIGILLYWLREVRRLEYGCVELGAASATAFEVTTQLALSPQIATPETISHTLLALMGAVYITVRGYDNIYQWLKKRAEHIDISPTSSRPDDIEFPETKIDVK